MNPRTYASPEDVLAKLQEAGRKNLGDGEQPDAGTLGPADRHQRAVPFGKRSSTSYASAS
jgi:hypothetical protein